MTGAEASDSKEGDYTPQKYLDNFVSILGSGTDTLLNGTSTIIGSTSWTGTEVSGGDSKEGDDTPKKYLDNFVSILGSGTDTLLNGSSTIIGSTGSLFASLIPPNSTTDSIDNSDVATGEVSTSESNTEAFNNFFSGLTTGIVAFIPDIAPSKLEPKAAADDDDDEDGDGSDDESTSRSSCSSSSIDCSHHSKSMSIDEINEVKKFENRLESSGYKADLHFPAKSGTPQSSRICVIKKQLPPSSTIVCTVSFNKKFKNLAFSVADMRQIARGSEHCRSRKDRDKFISVTIVNTASSSKNDKGILNFEFENSSVADSFFYGCVLLCKKYKNEEVRITEAGDYIEVEPSISAKTITPFNSPPSDADGGDAGVDDANNPDGSLLSRLRRSFTMRSPSPQNSDTCNDEELSKSSPDTPSPSLIARIRKSFTSQQQQAGTIDAVDDLTAPADTSPSLRGRIRKSITQSTPTSDAKDGVDHAAELISPASTPSPSLITRVRKSFTKLQQAVDIKREIEPVEEPVDAPSPLLNTGRRKSLTKQLSQGSDINRETDPVDDPAASPTPPIAVETSSPSLLSRLYKSVSARSLKASPSSTDDASASTPPSFKKSQSMQLSASSETSGVDSLKSPELKKEVNPNAAVIINYESFKPMCVADLLAAHDEKIMNSTLISNYDSFRPQSVEALLAAHEQKIASAAATAGSIPEEVDASAVPNSNCESSKPQNENEEALLAAHDQNAAIATAMVGSIPEEVDASAVLNNNCESFKPQSVDALLAAHDEKVSDNV